MPRILSLALAGAAALTSTGLHADPVKLDFETLADSTEVLQSYDGFQFSAGAYAFVSRALGGSGTFYGGAPDSARSALIVDGVSDGPDGMQRLRVDVAGGFSGFFSVSVGFLPGTTLTIKAYDAQGQLLAGTNGSNFNGVSGCTPPSYVCQWATVRLDLDAGVSASYVELIAPGGAGWLDDFTFGDVPGQTSPVPEPASAWMSCLGLAVLSLCCRRHMRAYTPSRAISS